MQLNNLILNEQIILLTHNPSVSRLYQILTTTIKLKDSTFSDDDLEVDLVIKVTVPDQQFISRKDKVSISQLIQNIDKGLQTAYQDAENHILNHMDQHSQYQQLERYQIRNFSTLQKVQGQPLSKLKKRIVTKKCQDDYEEHIEIQCSYQFKPILDLFTINYNALIYTLQTKAGFHVKSFLIENSETKLKQIFILLRQNDQNLYKIANNHKIKKEIDYRQFDFYLYEPTDKKNRFLINHSYFRNQEYKQVEFKKISRKFKVKIEENTQILNECVLEEKEKQKFDKYWLQKRKILEKVFLEESKLSAEEKQYVYLLNRNQINEGVTKQFLRIKRLREYVEQMKVLSEEYEYMRPEQPIAYFQFRFPSKKKSYFDRLRWMLRYKEMVISPYGDLALFLKMERIKLSYIALTQCLKVENFHQMGWEIFALNDNFQKYGKYQYYQSNTRQVKKQIRGGIDGKNLAQSWFPYLPWGTDFKTVRNYMGAHVAFELLLKNHIMSYFALKAGISLAAQVALTQITSKYDSSVYTFTYFSVMVICYNFFLVRWKIKEQEFLNNYTEASTQQIYRYDFKGPFIRNIVTDGLSQFPQNPSILTKIRRFVSISFIILLLAIEGAFFYGLRNAIIQYYHQFPTFTTSAFAISPAHTIFYGLFFWVNYYIYDLVFSKFITKAISFQNFPTDQQYKKSLRNQVFLYFIGVELIPPFFFFILEPFNRTSCYSIDCLTEFSLYIFSRYLIIFSFLLVKILYVILYYFKGGLQQIQKLINKDKKVNHQESYELKLNNLLEFVTQQSKKQELIFDMREEALSILHYMLFSLLFPSCSLLSLGGMMIQNILWRLQVLRNCRRPIPKQQSLHLYSDVFELVLKVSIMVNCWSIVYTGQILEYRFLSLLKSLLNVSTITEQKILIIKIIFAVLLMNVYLIISKIATSFAYSFNTKETQIRKNIKIDQIINQSIGSEKLNKYCTKQSTKNPLKTIFRTYHQNKNTRNSFKKNYDNSEQESYLSGMHSDTADNLTKIRLTEDSQKGL